MYAGPYEGQYKKFQYIKCLIATVTNSITDRPFYITIWIVNICLVGVTYIKV